MFERAFIPQILCALMNNTWASVANSLPFASYPPHSALCKTHTHTRYYTRFTHRWPGPGHFLCGWWITGFTSLLCSVALTDLFMDRKRQKHNQLIICTVCVCVYVCISLGELLRLQQQNSYWWAHCAYSSVIVVVVNSISTTLWQYNV